MSGLDKQLTRSILAAERREVDPFWERFGLPHNPFPPARTVVPELLHDQDHAVDRFAMLARDLLQPQPQRRALAIMGGTGVGKTHFLRHCCWAFEKAHRAGGRVFAIAYVQVGSIKSYDLVTGIVEAADRACVGSGETDLVTALVRRMAGFEGPELDPLGQAGVEQQDLIKALGQLVAAMKGDGSPRRHAGYDELREMFLRWIHGRSLTPRERQYLGVWERIATASLGIRVLRDLLALARSMEVIEGVLLCLDEVETLFTSGLRSNQYLGFLHDLRYLFDEAVRGATGFALLVVSGCTPEGARRLRDVNYPLFERLGFKEDSRVVLREISGVLEAREFAYAYIDHFHEQWKRNRGAAPPAADPRALLSEQEIEQCYWAAAKGRQQRLLAPGPGAGDGGYVVTQAALLEQLHRLAEQKHGM